MSLLLCRVIGKPVIRFVYPANSLLNLSRMTHSEMSNSCLQAKLLERSKKLAPSLSSESKYKGQAGKVGVFGGSFEYTGAPYFASIAALKVGADLSHVFCTREAAGPIKCYSPELIVHPLLDDGEKQFGRIQEWLDKFDVILIGPGLGRKAETFRVIELIINYWRQKRKPMVIDADGLFLITQKPSLLENFEADVILTPNKMEFARLLKLDHPDELPAADPHRFMRDAKWGSRVSVLVKGHLDEMIDCERRMSFCDLGGSGRRCGGQGDILAGSISVFLFWARQFEEDRSFVAAYAACKLVRECNSRGFAKKGRSLVSTDMLEEIHPVFHDNFEVDRN
ncbi:PREDICTED: ATP-dependent (S)-NAD(P)H-hydrate dehydratase [Nicrophorus vespilloides]|uniref:ATP-dependent (S)-NAD(P)H-hydrate dehydratase n=1 Tax=Nicrophorus vespilloides TaxID=110193 RepID=A0ABM1MR84_NICVS|nr:PREDICTED: ATP-dependent (S)-NAD(P)H-hydrate dehydratase [Nicrophorus vespilloides]